MKRLTVDDQQTLLDLLNKELRTLEKHVIELDAIGDTFYAHIDRVRIQELQALRRRVVG
jgi:hypothetical protein